MKDTSHFSQEVDQEIRLLKSIIKIQALLRGWLARRKFHSVQVLLYNSKVNKLLKEFSTTHLTKFSKVRRSSLHNSRCLRFLSMSILIQHSKVMILKIDFLEMQFCLKMEPYILVNGRQFTPSNIN